MPPSFLGAMTIGWTVDPCCGVNNFADDKLIFETVELYFELRK
jgi:hypothetical protein